ncbi:MAG: UDP-N-acetylmuramoyl-L-alanine--D-glutamate ligase, partial [Clostridia bacterium]|nr:UDP-N-acetylmuramoyl-L-alanine--D-glutamate ligase [Clostridia bacterium]
MTRLDEFKQNVKGKDITVIGIGISNLPLIKYLVLLGANVTACDRRTREDLGEVAAELEGMGAVLTLGGDYLKNLSGDIIFKT